MELEAELETLRSDLDALQDETGGGILEGRVDELEATVEEVMATVERMCSDLQFAEALSDVVLTCETLSVAKSRIQPRIRFRPTVVAGGFLWPYRAHPPDARAPAE